MPSILRLLGIGFGLLAMPALANLTLAREGLTRYVIVLDPEASPPEVHAAEELANTLRQATGADFPRVFAGTRLPRRAILVGSGPSIRRLFPDVAWDQLGEEEVLIRTRDRRLLLSGGRPRGTLYAVSRFLQDQCGVRWWTPWASQIPATSRLRIPDLDVRTRPAFEARDPFWYPAFDRAWAVRNFSNSQSAHLPADWGGGIQYRGFVHTFYPLVPPEEHFAAHPEWYSLVDGKRTHDHAQLCLTNPELLEFVIGRVRQWLKESPDARIVSISQNDWRRPCECAACKALDDAEGSHAGTMLAFVNRVAERLEEAFPQVAFDTLAYQYTRKPPKTIRPRPNVIVRLCSIECNFREPLDHPSNASFAEDIRGWSAICDRLYVWDYTTDFAHYVQPHPNWYVLGPNLRFFHQHHVRGMFEQGAYQSYGSEMAELRAWVLAQLLWNPFQDDQALIREFVNGYYGEAAAPHILRYFDLMRAASAGWNLTCFSKTDTPFHRFATLSQAEGLWNLAEQAAAGDPAHLLRVRMARLPVRYVWLTRWDSLKEECTEAGSTWPLPASRREVAEAFAAQAAGTPEAPWTHISRLNERGTTVEQFVERMKD